MSEDSHETSAQLIDPVPEKAGRVGIDEATCWNGWAYDDAENDELDPIAIFADRRLAEAFHAFLSSDHCPDGLRTNRDAAIMAAHVPQIIVANHMDDAESIAAMALLCGVGEDTW